MRLYLWKTVAVKDKGVQQLSRRQGHQHPTPPPPRFIPKPAIIVELVICEFSSARSHVNGDGDPKLITRVGPQGKPGQAGANRRCEAGRERFGDARISLPEGSSLLGEKIRAQAEEKPE